MRHLDANSLTQLIGAMAEVVATVAAPSKPLFPDVPESLEAAIEAFQVGWRPPATTSSTLLAARVERLAAAGMAFIEGDPLTATQLVAEPVERASAPVADSFGGGASTLTGRIAELQVVVVASEQAAADLTGRQLARRSFSGADRSIDAFRRFAAGHKAASKALADYLSLADAADERRRIVEELLGDTRQDWVPGAGDDHLARLHDKASTVDDEASASVDRCVASVRAAIPDDADLAAAYDGLEHAVEAVRLMLAEAAASETRRAVAEADRPAPGESRTVA